MIPLSVVVITKNEEVNIEACLESVRWADEIIVVDAQSADATVERVRAFTDKIFVEPWLGFSEAKTFAVGKAKNEWILWIDADERVMPELAAEIRELLSSVPKKSAYSVSRRAYFLGRWMKHSGWYPGRVVRLFQKKAARFTTAAVHEGLEVDGEIGELRHDLLHYTDPNLEHYFTKFNRYTTLAGNELFHREKKSSIVDILIRPPWLFFKMYIVRLGFLDGVPGLILAVLSSAYVFTKYAKVWEAWNSRNSG